MPNFKNNISVNGVFLAFIDSKKCNTLPCFYSEISNALNFPDYFGYNLDALDEAMCDLSWIEEKTILLLLFNYEEFMKDDKEDLQVINAVFSHVISELEIRGIYFSVMTQQ